MGFFLGGGAAACNASLAGILSDGCWSLLTYCYAHTVLEDFSEDLGIGGS